VSPRQRRLLPLLALLTIYDPVVAVALGYVVLAEPLSAGLLSGAALILLGVLLTTTARSRRQQQPEPLVEEPSASG